MSDKKRWIRLAVAAGLGAAAGAWTYQIQKDKKAKNDARLAVVEAAVVRSRDYGKQKAYISGGSSLAYKRLPFSWKQYYGVWGK